MKTQTHLSGGLVLLLALLVYVPARAQGPAPQQDGDSGSSGRGLSTVDSEKLEQAVALFEQGKLKEAQVLLAKIREHNQMEGDPSLIEGLCYEILCLHGLNDHHASMNLLSALEIGAPGVPPEIRESLAWAQIDGLFYFRKFEDIFSAIEAFRSAHPGVGPLGRGDGI